MSGFGTLADKITQNNKTIKTNNMESGAVRISDDSTDSHSA
jgi:hypothetical protein